MNRDFYHDNIQRRWAQSFAGLITSANFPYRSLCFKWISIFVSIFLLQASSISGQIYSHKSDKDTINIPAYTAPSNIFYKHEINLASNCNYTENFGNLILPESYSNGQFNGNNQIVWNYTDARNEGDYGIDGKGIMFRNNSGKLSSTLPNGISSFSCNLKKAFTGLGNRQVALYVNDILVKTSAAFNGSDVQVFTVEKY